MAKQSSFSFFYTDTHTKNALFNYLREDFLSKYTILTMTLTDNNFHSTYLFIIFKRMKFSFEINSGYDTDYLVRIIRLVKISQFDLSQH